MALLFLEYIHWMVNIHTLCCARLFYLTDNILFNAKLSKLKHDHVVDIPWDRDPTWFLEIKAYWFTEIATIATINSSIWGTPFPLNLHEILHT